MGKIEGEYSADYLWNKKNIVSFLKVDKGLEEEENGVKLMKTIPDLENQLDEANEKIRLVKEDCEADLITYKRALKEAEE